MDKIHLFAENVWAFGRNGINLNLHNQGLHLILGQNDSSKSKSSNGSGKSGILVVFDWVIFGKFPEKVRKAKFINSEIGKNGLGIVTIKKQKHTGIITRALKHTEMEVYPGKTLEGDFLVFTLDGKDMRGKTDTETQARILDFFGVDYEGFNTTILFSAGEESSYAAQTPATQDKIFTNLLDVGVLAEARERTSTRKKKIDKQLKEVSTNITTTENHINVLTETIESIDNQAEIWKEQQEIKQKNLGQDILDLGEEQQIKTDKVENFKQTLKELKEELNLLTLQIKISTEDLQQKKEKYQKELSGYEQELGKESGTINSVGRAIKEAQSLKGNPKCPKCGSKLTEEHLFQHISELNEIVDEAKELKKEIEEDISSVRSSIQEIQNKINQQNQRENQVVRTTSEIRQMESQINNAVSQLDHCTTTLLETKKMLETLKVQKPPQTKNSEELQSKKEKLIKELAELQKEEKVLRHKLELIEFWNIGFGPNGIRNFLVESILPELNKLAMQYSSVLTNNELEIVFNAEKTLTSGEKRNKLGITINDLTGSDSYESSSGGEKRRIDLCIGLAIHSLVSQSKGFPFVMMDEIFLSLDSTGREMVLDLLEIINEEIPSIWVISNLADISEERFDDVYLVIRQNKQSQLVKKEY